MMRDGSVTIHFAQFLAVLIAVVWVTARLIASF